MVAGLLDQHTDDQGRRAVEADLRVLHGEPPVRQPLVEPYEPLLAREHKAEPADAGEVFGEQTVQLSGIVVLLG